MSIYSSTMDPSWENPVGHWEFEDNAFSIYLYGILIYIYIHMSILYIKI